MMTVESAHQANDPDGERQQYSGGGSREHVLCD